MSGTSQRFIWLARGAIVAPALFIAGWLVAGVLQDPAFSSARHDISDLGALTARAPWVMLLPQGVAGALTVAFALGALRPALRVPGHREPLGAWCVALSLMGVDNLTDPFFRLPCRAADAGCTPAVAFASLSGTVHVGIGIGAALFTAAAPFALARRMRLSAQWRDLAREAYAFGVLFIALLVVYGALDGAFGQGYVQRVMTFLIAVGIMVLARRVEAIARSDSRAATVSSR
jgi:Protein of unknown function (DUF998)